MAPSNPTPKVRVRPRQVDDGRGVTSPAPIPRQPNTDITRGPSGERSRHAIAPEGEDVLLTPYIRRLIARGDLIVVGSEPAPKPKQRPKSAE